MIAERKTPGAATSHNLDAAIHTLERAPNPTTCARPMTLIAARALRTALPAFAISLFLSPAPGWAQERQQSTSPGAASERWETFREDAGALFGNLFGRSDRAQANGLPREERPTVVAQMSAGDLMVRL